MRYNDFGNTGIKISAIGFGCMRLPMIEASGKKVVDQDQADVMLKRAYELGVNYYDTAYMYNDHQSEIAVGKALKGFRDKVYVSTKSPGHLVKKPGDYTRILEEQLKKLDMEYVDFYHFHGVGYKNFLKTDKNAHWMDEARKAKEQGLIKHISFSFHDKPEAMKQLIDLGY
ncbi:MAG: aldo/keto reductase, partial [Clostridia bacterium]|nr:aldo/keto reductase [Clostridia bacterium]